ncbi:MAG: ABC transporter ATP-binding protein/permease [Lachnospiraceae bacterium]|nr:ABC transporter ATP-binding protein/permease [Lachnospiraceae bacterium]
MANRNTFFEDEKIEKKVDMRQMWRTLAYILPYKRLLFLVSCMMLAAAVVSLLPPRLLKLIVDEVVVNQDYRQMAMVGGGLVLLAAVEILSTFVQARSMGRMGLSIITRIRTDIFEKLQILSFDYFDNRPDGKIVVRVTEYINGLADFFSNYVMMFAIYIVKLVVVTVFMLSLSPVLTLIVFGSVAPMMGIIFWLRSHLRKMYTIHRSKNSNRTAFLVESIMGEQIVKNYNRIGINKEIYRQIHEESMNMWWDIVKKSRLNGPVVQLFWHTGTLCIFGVALALILGGDIGITAGMVITFTSYMGAFQDPLAQLSTIIQELAQVSSNLEQVFDTIDYPVEIQDKENPVVLKEVKGKVDFQDVTFCYEKDIKILKDFTLHVRPGETIALVGPTGAGKTTVISMLTRFYDVREGCVKIDDVDVRDASLYSLRSEVGVLMQDPFIFKGTILDNIRYGRWDATDEECKEAARKIFADKFIKRLNGGYEHMLEERGSGLSAGERQLISFARIILKNPSIVILDEATSAIDTETELLIQEALEVLLHGKTAFIVAHRLSTIRNADRILYISNQGIAEEGTHEELMAKRGLYYELASCS